MRNAGYTLIEILIVLFILGIVTSVALLSINQNDNKRMESFANEITQIMTLAEEQAMLEPNVLGLSITEHAFQFASLQPGKGSKKNSWLPLEDVILGKHHIPRNIQIAIAVGGTPLNVDNLGGDPQIIISMNGDITPFTIYVSKKGEKPRYAIIGDGDGNVTNQLLS
jgi:general secretion pathway protein H